MLAFVFAMEVNGSDGIPREGREVEYATELWLNGPSAFWLHPEGPLSETTPDEWREKVAKERAAREATKTVRQRMIDQLNAQYACSGLLQSSLYRQAIQRNSQNYYQNRYYSGLFGLGGVFGL